MKNINEHIKKSEFSKSYLLYGEETYLLILYKNRLNDSISGNDSMNFSFYEGKDINLHDMADTSRTLPFFAERRLILVENSGFFKSSSEDMVKILMNAPETTYFIFAETEVDKRNKLYKAVNEGGYVCELKYQSEDALTTWCNRFISEAGKKITRNDMSLFLSKTGPMMDNIFQELQKLLAYTKNEDVITREAIEEICTVQTEDRVFDMINAIAMKKRDEAMKLYSDLLVLKEPPMKILVLLGKQFATLLAVREMLDTGNQRQVIADKLSIRPYFIGRYIDQAKGFTLKQLRQAVTDCADADMSVKTGQSEDKYVVELIILKYSR